MATIEKSVDPAREVLNQPPPLQPVDLLEADLALREGVEREGGGWGLPAIREAGVVAGGPEALEHGCRALHPHASLVTGTLVADARHAGLSLAVWTVNDRAQLEAMADHRVDTVITDDVPLALSALGRT